HLGRVQTPPPSGGRSGGENAWFRKFKCYGVLRPFFPVSLPALGNHLFVFFPLFRGQEKADSCLGACNYRFCLGSEPVAERSYLFMGLVDDRSNLFLLPRIQSQFPVEFFEDELLPALPPAAHNRFNTVPVKDVGRQEPAYDAEHEDQDNP